MAGWVAARCKAVGAVVSREVAAGLAQLNPGLWVEQIVDAGHGIPYDQPERLATAVQAFLGTPLHHRVS